MHPSLRLYEEARTAHLERARDDDVQLAFRRVSYDFDPQLASRIGAKKLSRIEAVKAIVSARYSQVEINEPLMLSAWPSLLMYVAASRIAARRGRTKWSGLVAYAIENGSIEDWVQSRTRLPTKLATAMSVRTARWIARGFRRIAFGTEGARSNYERLLGKATMARIETRTFTALEAPCPCMDGTVISKDEIVFLGSFEERKGLPLLMDAWRSVRHTDSSLTLTLVGKGPMESEVTAWARDNSAHVVIDPPRDTIHETLRSAKLVVLLSQPARRWREQVGLPLLEGLSHGCEVLTTTESGLAGWLRENDHHVLDPRATSAKVAEAILKVVRSTSRRDHILAQLPQVGGRLQAERWLSGSSEPEAAE